MRIHLFEVIDLLNNNFDNVIFSHTEFVILTFLVYVTFLDHEKCHHYHYHPKTLADFAAASSNACLGSFKP
jgi:hypothetical protein